MNKLENKLTTATTAWGAIVKVVEKEVEIGQLRARGANWVAALL